MAKSNSDLRTAYRAIRTVFPEAERVMVIQHPDTWTVAEWIQCWWKRELLVELGENGHDLVLKPHAREWPTRDYLRLVDHQDEVRELLRCRR